MRQPATEKEARKRWRYTKGVLTREAQKAFKQREIWGFTENEYPVVVSGDGEWAIGFAKDERGNVFSFDVFAYVPNLPRGEQVWPLWLMNGVPKG